jgi:hypothetical protein
MSLYDGQKIIEIVRYATSQSAHSFHLLSLPKLTFKNEPFGLVLFQRIPHSIECSGHLGDLIAALRVERIGKIAFFKRSNPIYQSS